MPTLTLVPTPIGNLADITHRAEITLRQCDFVLAEDSRQAKKLLQHLGISKPVVSFHLANEHRVLESVMSKIQTAQLVALVSDAGTPGISDPGYLLVRQCLREGVQVQCLPGPTAFVPALVCSGLPCDRFVFEGFLPHKKGRETRVKALAGESRTVVLYESPHRLLKTLELLRTHCSGQRAVCVCREISKMFEEFIRGSMDDVIEHFAAHEPRGEIVIVLGTEGAVF